jgi:integrase
MHSGAQIDIDAYIDFIKEHGAKFEKVAALDCIGDWRGTEKNLQYMRGKGVNPIPVFHTNEPFDYLDCLLKENEYLCLGVTGSKLRQAQIIAWLVEVFKHRERINPTAKLHGFALTSAKIMRFFDWDSCDSTAWNTGGRFSIVYYLRGNNLESYSRDEWHKLTGLVPQDVFLTRRGNSERVIPIWKHNAETILRYVDIINQSKVAAKSTLKN